MSRRKDTDYLAVSARIRAMENRLLTRERMDRIIDAREEGEARKILAECGYPEVPGEGLEEVLALAREQTMKELTAAVPDPRVPELFRLKYDYHNAKTILKARAMELPPDRLLLSGGRYEAKALLEGWERGSLSMCSDTFRRAMEAGWEMLKQTQDPQQADLLLDKAMYAEMAQLAKELKSPWLEGYVKLLADAANLRTCVRVSRMGKESDFLGRVLLDGGNVSVRAIAAARGEEQLALFRTGALAQAAKLGGELLRPGSGALTAFEKACDDAVTDYVSAARRVPFGEQVVMGYLYARESELTAVRTIFVGRQAGLDGDTIRRRLRATYC